MQVHGSQQQLQALTTCISRLQATSGLRSATRTSSRGFASALSQCSELRGRLLCRVECPLDVWKNWYSYHVPCVHSFHEKVLLGLPVSAWRTLCSLLHAPVCQLLLVTQP